MSGLQGTYHEHLLHWIWQSLHFELSDLQTTCGQPVTILDQGALNKTDGPDFTNARLQIGNLEWHGDIEFHWSETDWNNHRHHRDPNYNAVILHVIYHAPGNHPITREDATTPFTLHLKPHLPDNLDRMLAAYHQSSNLPCAGQLHHISDEVLEQQFERAHREYFESKADELLQRYDPSLPPARAWKRMLTVGLFDGLGISQNRDQMRRAAQELYKILDSHFEAKAPSCPEELQMEARKLARPQNSRSTCISWNRKGCRPANRPELRLLQAVWLLWEIENKSLNVFYQTKPARLWQSLRHSVQTDPGIGRERSDILFGTVFLPALWLLGNLFHIPALKQTAFEQWMSHEAQIPNGLFRLFEQTDISKHIYQNRLGAVYQLKYYCKPRRCDQCNVLKVLISS